MSCWDDVTGKSPLWTEGRGQSHMQGPVQYVGSMEVWKYGEVCGTMQGPVAHTLDVKNTPDTPVVP